QSFEIKGSSWFNEKRAAPPTVSIHCGESGLSMRMFTSIASILNTSVLISGSGSLLSRPMHFFESVLQDLGVQINTDNGRAPIRLKGPLKPDSISFDGSLSSQFLTGILIALAYVAKQRLVVTVRNLKSRPYITLTLQMMQEFGYKVSTPDYE